MFIIFFFFKQKTAYEMRISDWSSDVCSSDLACCGALKSCEGCSEVALKPSFVAADASPMCSAGSCRRSLARALRIPIRLMPNDLLSARSCWYAESRSRTEERRVGKERVRTCRCRVLKHHSTKTMNNTR